MFPEIEGWVLKAIEAAAPGEMERALEQTDRVPSLALILITFVFNILTPAKLATPDTEVTGFVVALNPEGTTAVQLALE